MNYSEKTQKVNPKAHYEPRSEEEWQKWLRKDTYGAFLIFRELYRSPAFEELRRHPKYVLVLLEAFSQLNFERSNNRAERHAKKRGVPCGTKARVYKNGGMVYLTQNRLKALGIGVATQSAAKKALVSLGFLDGVLMPASANEGQFCPSVFRVSTRWRKYPNVPPQEDGITITRRVYSEHSLSNPDHSIHRKRREAQNPIQILNAPAIQEVNARKSEPIQKVNASTTPFAQNHHSRTECILKDFHGVQDDTKAEHSDDEHEAVKSVDTSEGHTLFENPIDQQLLRSGIPAKIAIFMVSRGHSCTLARKRGGKRVQLGFSNGCSVHIRPTEYEYFPDGSNGKGGIVFKEISELERLIRNDKAEHTR